MYHCISFSADEIYYLKETEIYTKRILSIGFCPICSKPVAELIEYNFAGGMNKTTTAGLNAHTMMLSLKNEILSAKQKNKTKKSRKPFGWIYGVNKELRSGKIKQYAHDFYGNKELIKSF